MPEISAVSGTGGFRSLHLCDAFVISCGTVTIDPQAKKLLIIQNRENGEYYLPKGRKNTDETLEAAAIRETYEETGVHVSLTKHGLPTLAGRSAADRNVKSEYGTREPVAVSQRIVSGGVLKVIFWYLAVANSDLPVDNDTQDEGEDLKALWLLDLDAMKMLSFEDDREITMQAMSALAGAE